MANSFDFHLRWVIIAMAYLPVASCFFCIIWTVLTKSSLVYAAAMADCPESSSFPTVSVSIGPWEPQRLVWISAMLIHAPMRICVTVLYPTVWPLGKLRTSLMFALICEALATLLVCVFHVQSIAGECEDFYLKTFTMP
ncbi:hypothetical protein PRIPAC_77096 [Pristionchus pacificus]|uniref:CWH43-like N-terminal domain-containing protein n=1 Tax=Pristionchus pacificus TaxID=54126 RepID=A0A2A6C3A3_PRIPA|nr:hypothetical protein PRIPAC_77096 [Pristionchus pacificus]|eukprot:PDM72599.1 hypothetical protein PRIPAC_39033 [Pristionchus pacificus]